MLLSGKPRALLAILQVIWSSPCLEADGLHAKLEKTGSPLLCAFVLHATQELQMVRRR